MRQAQLALVSGRAMWPPARRPSSPDGEHPAGELADTYALFTGGRAMSENLQLDRVLTTVVRRPRDGGTEIARGNHDSGDRLEAADQGSETRTRSVGLPRSLQTSMPIFFPSFNAAVAVADEMAAQSAMVLELAEPRSTSARTFDRYQEQMCLSITGLARLLGPAVVQSVAITGSDPYFRTGTDVAVLFEAADAADARELADGPGRSGGRQERRRQGRARGSGWAGLSGRDHAGPQHLQLSSQAGQPGHCHELALSVEAIGERQREQDEVARCARRVRLLPSIAIRGRTKQRRPCCF